jgi:hypothetical protein
MIVKAVMVVKNAYFKDVAGKRSNPVRSAARAKVMTQCGKQ